MLPHFTTWLTNLRCHLAAERILTDPADCLVYGYDNSRQQVTPAAVVFPLTHDEVTTVVQHCNEFQIPIVARGRGTGTTGGVVPIQGGVVLALERMQKITLIDAANRFACVEPGVLNQTLQNALAPHGFFWPPDPSSSAFCSIGGNLGYNSAGPRAVKYGTPRENTLGLRAVLGTGETINTGVYTTKGVVGYDLTRLIIGSEGTLAIITSAILKLTPLPQTKRLIRAIYNDIDAAAKVVAAIMAQPVIPSALEFMDKACIDIIRKSIPLPNNAGAVLLIEVDGINAAMVEMVSAIVQAAQHPGLILIETAQNEIEIEKLWQARKALSPALRNIAPNKISEDVVVPVSNLAALINGAEKIGQKHQIQIVNFGHAGNGNIHVNLLTDDADPKNKDKIESCLQELFDLVLHLKGTLSGEHGVAMSKKNYIAKEIDPTTLSLMKKIKVQFDPNSILNPGKIFP